MSTPFWLITPFHDALDAGTCPRACRWRSSNASSCALMAGGAFKTGAVGAGVAAASMNVARPPPIQAAIMRKGSPREAAPTWLIGEKVRLRPIEPGDVTLL